MEHRDPLVLVNLSVQKPSQTTFGALLPNMEPSLSERQVPMEKVQHRFTRLFPELRSFSYIMTGWKSWSCGRLRKGEIERIWSNCRRCHAVLIQSLSRTTLTPQHVPTRGHSWKLIKPHSSTDARRFFFSVWVINKWNSLPQETVDASSVNMFKNQLDRIRNSRMGFFMDS